MNQKGSGKRELKQHYNLGILTVLAQEQQTWHRAERIWKIEFLICKSKSGNRYIWVKRVEHDITGSGHEVVIWIEGEILNRYREFIVEKALFQEKIVFMDAFDNNTYPLDKGLQMFYKDWDTIP